MKKRIFWALITFLIIIISLLVYFFMGNKPLAENINWGVNFSQKQALDLSLEPKEIYIDMLDNLKVRNIKIAMHWDLIEKTQDSFDMEDFDFYMEEAKKRDAKVILAIGIKTPRWPEYHMPSWLEDLTKEEQQEEILEMISFVVERYKDYPNLIAWQIENEPFFNYGKAPWKDNDFLKKEIEIAKKIDDSHNIIITDSGEMSFWIKAARLGDIVGITMYTKVWSETLKDSFSYFLPAVFYGKKADLIKLIFNKEVWCLELQAEPWAEELIQDASLEKQLESMDIDRFRYNIEYAKKTGLNTFYFWGGEWWYYMQEKHHNSSFLNEAKKLWN